jgi:hypothetical protein
VRFGDVSKESSEGCNQAITAFKRGGKVYMRKAKSLEMLEVETDAVAVTSNMFEDTEAEIEVTPEKLEAAIQEFEQGLETAPLIPGVEGMLEEQKSDESLTNVGYYVVYTAENSPGNGRLLNSHISRFESKVMLKRVVMSLKAKGFKIVEIIRGRPLSYTITPKVTTRVEIGR